MSEVEIQLLAFESGLAVVRANVSAAHGLGGLTGGTVTRARRLLDRAHDTAVAARELSVRGEAIAAATRLAEARGLFAAAKALILRGAP